ncbi:type VI secretion system tip protein TssI/VgrG [Sorangium sp. So ce260]|uniref:type VI secretion system Vgr family protein n=1 Tax=Sorangium sp. So ce260 TaxID=3133291 RepID=UPI003F5EBD06
MASLVDLEHELTVDGAGYHVLWIEAHEPLDDIGVMRCEITDHAGGPEPAALVGKTLVITLSRPGGEQERKLVGYVVEAESTTSRGDEETGVRVTARPRIFRLTQRTDCRIFQDIPAPEIVKKVLVGAGVPEDAQRWQLAGSYPKRAYTAQYRETDFEFIRRLLSEEGIAFAVDSSSGADVVALFDADLGDIDGDKTIPHRPGDGLNAPGDAVGAVSCETSTAPGKVHLRDYDFEHPRVKLDAKAEGDDDSERALEVYHYPGRFKVPATGDHLAEVLLQSLRARRETVSAATNTLRLHPGRKFELEDHPYAPLNREYLVLGVSVALDLRSNAHQRQGEVGERVRLSFSAIPAATRYRPPRVPRAVAAPGAQVAVTTGPAGKEIHTDARGRVKVFFPWDRLGKPDYSSSLWIRTCQIPLGGGMLTPRVGWEVYLNFTDGDPDLPFVFGRLYNGKTPPPYPLPQNKTRTAFQTATTPGGGSSNEIRMDDKAGSEEMFINASKDAAVSAGNNATETVGNNETRSIGANHALSVTDSMSASIGANQAISVGADQTIHVSTFMAEDVGSHWLSIGGNRDLKAGGDHKRTVTGASTLTIGGMQVDLVAGSADENGLATMDDKVGAALIELTASGRTVTVKESRTETVGAAKVILSGGGRAVEVGTGLKQKVAGAVLNKIGGDRADTTEGDFLEVAGGAQLIKATNVVFHADQLLSVVMGASTITLTPASVSIAGAKITLDGECDEVALLVTDN